MSLAPKVEVKDGKVYQDGKLLEKTGEFYLVRKGTFEELVNRLRERNTSAEERECIMSDEMKEALPQWIEIDDGFTYLLEKEIAVSRGKFLWVRYRTIEQELETTLQEDKTREGGQK